MARGAHAFDARVRVLECRNCGAPATTLPSEDHFRCAYCSAVNVYQRAPSPSAPSPSAASPSAEQQAALEVGRALSNLERMLVSAERVAWVRAEVAKPGVRAVYDVIRNAPGDLVAMSGITDWVTWVEKWLPALREHWKSVVPREGTTVTDPAMQHRLYWLGMRLSQAYGFKARQHPESAEEAHLQRRAVLETAAQHLAGTPFAAVLCCALSRAASHAGDPESARAFLAKYPVQTVDVELDGELRIALAAAYAAEKRPTGTLILQLLEPGGELPLLTDTQNLLAIAYRIHAYEVMGNDAVSRDLVRIGLRRYGAGRLRGCLGMENIAPRAYGKLEMRVTVGFSSAIIAALLIIGAVVWFVVTRVF